MRSVKEILLVEDTASDADAVHRALKGAGLVNPVRWIRDGTAALRYLEQAELTAAISPSLPAVLLLDLKLPGASGFEILERIQGRSAFAEMLTVVLSQITDLKSIKRAYRHGAYSFLSKPIQAMHLRELIRSFPGHWLFGGTDGRPAKQAAAFPA